MHVYRLLLLSLGFSLILTACAPQTRYQVLRFFFDGVPAPEQESDSRNTIIVAAPDSITQTDAIEKAPIQEIYVLHPPYQEKMCGECHNVREGFSLIKQMPDLCYGCHDDFRDSYQHLHGPVASGYCATCHKSHMSKNQKLLVKPEAELCYHCHSRSYFTNSSTHYDIESMLCQDCHNPHGGSDIYFLE